jgi:hypothetical protein
VPVRRRSLKSIRMSWDRQRLTVKAKERDVEDALQNDGQEYSVWQIQVDEFHRTGRGFYLVAWLAFTLAYLADFFLCFGPNCSRCSRIQLGNVCQKRGRVNTC